MTSRGVQFLSSDMDEHAKVKTELKSVVQDALNNSENVDEKHISAQIKRKLDEQYGPTWHCIVGGDFKAKMSHESKSFCFLNAGKMNVLIFKT